MDESLGESAMQFCIQQIFYLVSVSTAVRANGPEAATSITFDRGLLLSSTISVLSLSIGQFKVFKLGLGKFYILQREIHFDSMLSKTYSSKTYFSVAGSQSKHRVFNISLPEDSLLSCLSW